MKFTVRKRVDAFIDYEAEVEAESAKDAVELAQYNEAAYAWEQAGEAEFDARLFVAVDEDGNEIAGTETELG
jgi:hypothetical protein